MLHRLLETAAILPPDKVGEERTERRLEALDLIAGRDGQAKPEMPEIGLPIFVG